MSGIPVPGSYPARVRLEAIGVADLLGATDVFGRLYVYILALSVISDILQLLPAVGSLLSIIVSLAISGFLLFTSPLIIDQKLDVMAAVRGSMEALRGQV